jgi:hypothetical protein
MHMTFKMKNPILTKIDSKIFSSETVTENTCLFKQYFIKKIISPRVSPLWSIETKMYKVYVQIYCK